MTTDEQSADEPSAWPPNRIDGRRLDVDDDPLGLREAVAEEMGGARADLIRQFEEMLRRQLGPIAQEILALRRELNETAPRERYINLGGDRKRRTAEQWLERIRQRNPWLDHQRAKEIAEGLAEKDAAAAAAQEGQRRVVFDLEVDRHCA
ncbi:MAG: hypothetical protein OXH38_11775 [Chloroflexi bacterium]|nr:hypothetical protein [Chloroflexota bacterium]